MNSLLNVAVCRLATARRRRAVFAAALSVAAALVGCGGSAPTPSNAAAGAGGRATPAAPSAEVPSSGALQFSDPQLQRAAGAPLALTASDGTGLTLTSLVARAVVREPLAFTELVLRFDNPRDRSIEGTFSITLPPRASIARFAMRNAEGWQEAEVVELQAARRAYEDFLHRKQDPALLEQAAGNQFTARVFPIPAHAVKELVVSYAEELSAGQPYALPLKGLPEVEELDVSITDRAGTTERLSAKKTRPSGDLTLASGAAMGAVRSGGRVAARIAPLAEMAPDPIRGLTLLVDTSGSRAAGFAEQVQLVGELVARLSAAHGSFALRVACFDQDVSRVFDGVSTGFGAPELAALSAHAALGASNLDGALAWTAEHAAGTPRVLLLSDGVATAGGVDAPSLKPRLSALRSAGVERLDVLAVGGIRDERLLQSLVVGALPRDGVVASADLGVARIVAKLGAATQSGLSLKVDGATFWYPEQLNGVQPADVVTVYAELPAGKPLRVSVQGAAWQEVNTTPAEAPLLERALAQAHVDSLLARGSAEPEARAEIVRRAVASRIVTPYTALLVLENEEDYPRFGIDRRALKNVLSVQGGKLQSQSRVAVHGVTAKPPEPPALDIVRPKPATSHSAESGEASVQAPSAPEPAPADGDARAAEGSERETALGETFAEPIRSPAAAGAGLGSGQGRLGGAHATRAPSIRSGSVSVSGGLPPEVVQRIVRQNYGRLRLCYERRLQTHPDLALHFTLRFVIGVNGSVSQVSTTPPPEDVAVHCMIQSFYGVSFPAPEGGPASVTLPLHFQPNGAGSAGPDERETPPPVEAPSEADPYDGQFAEIMAALTRNDVSSATAGALAWHAADPGDVLALVALGEVYTAARDVQRAARAYGSILDLFPARADMRRFAGARLEGLSTPQGDALAVDSYAKALQQRPDHPSSHRLYAWALYRSGKLERAFDAAVHATKLAFAEDRFPAVARILREDVGLLAAAWARAEPKRAAEIKQRAEAAEASVESAPSLRFVLTWETDANDVDFHIYDSAGGHAYYGNQHLRSGGDLYADITTGYGPECFTIRMPKQRRAKTYTLQANYYSRGPMGYGMGKLQVIEHDGHGQLRLEEHPYVVMKDQAFVNLGVIQR